MTMNLRLSSFYIRLINLQTAHDFGTQDLAEALLLLGIGDTDRSVAYQLGREGPPGHWASAFSGSIVNFGRNLDAGAAHLALHIMGLTPADRLEHLISTIVFLGPEPLSERVVVLPGTFEDGTYQRNRGMERGFAFGRPYAQLPGRRIWEYCDEGYDENCWFLCKSRSR